MYRFLFALLLAVILVAGSIAFFSTTDIEQNNSVVFAVTDAAADMESVSSVQATINSVSVYNQDAGWVSVTNDSSTFSLLELEESNQNKLLAQSELDNESYSQVRIGMSEVTITETSGAQSQAVLPANEITFNADIQASKSATSSVLLDVQVNESLHIAQNGQYIFAPVVTLESRQNPDITVNENGIVTISEGSLASSVIVGVDSQGQSRSNFQLDDEAELQIGPDESITVSNTGNDSLNTSSEATVSTSSIDATTSVDVLEE